MSTFYFLALCGVSVAVLGILCDAVAGASRKAQWHPPAYASAAAPEARPQLAEVGVLAVEPRHSGFVGLTNSEEFQLTA